MNYYWLLPIIGQTIIFPEHSIASWILWAGENGLNKFFIFPIVFIFGNWIVASLFWPKIFVTGLFVVIYRFLKKSRKIVSLFNKTTTAISASVNKMLDYLNVLKESEKSSRFPLSFYLLGFLIDFLLAIFLLWEVIKIIFIGIFEFIRRIFKKIVIKITAFSSKTKKNLVKAGYAGIIVGGIVPLIPGFRQGGVVTAMSIGTNRAKATFLTAEAIRIILEIFFAEEVRQLITKIF